MASKRKPHLKNNRQEVSTGRKRKEKGKTQQLTYRNMMVVGPSGKTRMEKWPL